MINMSGHCASVPEFERLNYFYGQVLGHRELAKEQAFFRDKLRLHNRCLHGWGVVCGLELKPLPPAPNCPGDTDPHAPPAVRVEIGCGLALDCQGNELVVREPIAVDLYCLLDDADRQELEHCERTTLYVSLCFKERWVNPVRSALAEPCGVPSDVRYGAVRDAVKVKVALKPPERERRCGGCCEDCSDCCVELARIEHFRRGAPVEAHHLHPEVRRMVATQAYEFAAIASVNWVHGFHYRQEQAHHLLRHGLEVHFTKPVRTATIQAGVADFWVVEGGDGRSSGIYNLEGTFELDRSQEYTPRLVYRQRSKETLQHGDRLIFTLRTAFLLDHCCRPVDGEHVGGRVPYSGERTEPIEKFLAERACPCPPVRPAWISGNGTGGGSFESWFYVREDGAESEHGEASERHGHRRAGGER